MSSSCCTLLNRSPVAGSTPSAASARNSCTSWASAASMRSAVRRFWMTSATAPEAARPRADMTSTDESTRARTETRRRRGRSPGSSTPTGSRPALTVPMLPHRPRSQPCARQPCLDEVEPRGRRRRPLGVLHPVRPGGQRQRDPRDPCPQLVGVDLRASCRAHPRERRRSRSRCRSSIVASTSTCATRQARSSARRPGPAESTSSSPVMRPSATQELRLVEVAVGGSVRPAAPRCGSTRLRRGHGPGRPPRAAPHR